MAWVGDMLTQGLAAGIEDGYWQEPDSSGEDMIPAFDGTGLD